MAEVPSAPSVVTSGRPQVTTASLSESVAGAAPTSSEERTTPRPPWLSRMVIPTS
jgi:hypothetical protein